MEAEFKYNIDKINIKHYTGRVFQWKIMVKVNTFFAQSYFKSGQSDIGVNLSRCAIESKTKHFLDSTSKLRTLK